MSIDKLADLIDMSKPVGSAPNTLIGSVQKQNQGREDGEGSKGKLGKGSTSWADESEKADVNPLKGSNLGPPMQIEVLERNKVDPLFVGGQAKLNEEKEGSQPNQNTYSAVVRSNRIGGAGFSPRSESSRSERGDEVVITEADWNQGGSLWRHAIMGMVSHRSLKYDLEYSCLNSTLRKRS